MHQPLQAHKEPETPGCKNPSASISDLCELINTDPSMIPSYSLFQLGEFSPILMVLFLVPDTFTPKPSYCGLFYFGLTVILTLKKQTRDKSGLNRSDWLPLLFSAG